MQYVQWATQSTTTVFKYPHPVSGYVRITIETNRVDRRLVGESHWFNVVISRIHMAGEGTPQWAGTLTTSMDRTAENLHEAHSDACVFVEALFGFNEE